MQRHKNTNHDIWFVKTRGSYLPCSWQGWVLYLPMIAFLVIVFVYANLSATSIIDALFIYFPYFVCTGVVMHWIAANKS